MKKLILSFAILISGACMFASCNLISSAGFNSKGLPSPDAGKRSSATQKVEIDHGIWDQLLQDHVKANGRVDYKGFQNDREKLDNYLKMISSQKPSKDWGTDELLAYYINLYNAYTVDLILRNYPVNSIKDINGPWTKEFVKIGDTEISLGGIENSILRKMNEPRIHFAINCASISCPKLMNQAYTAEKIDEQLEKAAREFINSDKNEISGNLARLSSIFDWYKKDFTRTAKTLVEYINQYSDTKLNSKAKISYMDYNWNLNDVK